MVHCLWKFCINCKKNTPAKSRSPPRALRPGVCGDNRCAVVQTLCGAANSYASKACTSLRAAERERGPACAAGRRVNTAPFYSSPFSKKGGAISPPFSQIATESPRPPALQPLRGFRYPPIRGHHQPACGLCHRTTAQRLPNVRQ